MAGSGRGATHLHVYVGSRRVNVKYPVCAHGGDYRT